MTAPAIPPEVIERAQTARAEARREWLWKKDRIIGTVELTGDQAFAQVIAAHARAEAIEECAKMARNEANSCAREERKSTYEERHAWAEGRRAADSIAEAIEALSPPAPEQQLECSFPDCGCAEARLCMGRGGANSAARAMNLPKRKGAAPEQVKEPKA